MHGAQKLTFSRVRACRRRHLGHINSFDESYARRQLPFAVPECASFTFMASRADRYREPQQERRRIARPCRLRCDIPNIIAPFPPPELRDGVDAEPTQDGLPSFRTQQWSPLTVFGGEVLVGNITGHRLSERTHIGSHCAIFHPMLRPQPRTEYGYDHISFPCSICFKSCPMRACFNYVARPQRHGVQLPPAHFEMPRLSHASWQQALDRNLPGFPQQKGGCGSYSMAS